MSPFILRLILSGILGALAAGVYEFTILGQFSSIGLTLVFIGIFLLGEAFGLYVVNSTKKKKNKEESTEYWSKKK